ncbi:MAG: heterodisulfide reductase-related iron-sulfur binding cluster [Myxococcota bacterium]
MTSAGCSAALRELEHWIGSEGHALAGGVRDVLDFLAEVGAVDPVDGRAPALTLAPIPRRVCYDDPCHLIHAQGIAAAPRRLLAAIPRLELAAHRNPEACCGAAGIYNLTHPEMAARVLAPEARCPRRGGARDRRDRESRLRDADRGGARGARERGAGRASDRAARRGVSGA